MKLLLRIAYDGRNYCGFQKQHNGVSIQEVLTDALSRTVGMPCSVTGCSRTDAGVHAIGFCAAVEPKEKQDGKWITVPPEKMHRAARRYLPEDIAITGACLVPEDFHPRYSVTGKTYLYRFSDRPCHDPFCTDRVWETYVPLTDAQIVHMHEAGQILVGKHNFASLWLPVPKSRTPPGRSRLCPWQDWMKIQWGCGYRRMDFCIIWYGSSPVLCGNSVHGELRRKN